MRTMRRVAAILALPSIALACEAPPGNKSSAPAMPSTLRAPVFVDRTKQVPYDRGQARLGSIRATLLSPALTPAQTSALGFECASLRSEELALAREGDSIVLRFIADADKTCGLDVPLAAAYAELRAMEAKRGSGASLKSECLGLKVAIGDFAPKYLSNPMVAAIGGKYATYCHAE
jgi:hypothetical protein